MMKADGEGIQHQRQQQKGEQLLYSHLETWTNVEGHMTTEDTTEEDHRALQQEVITIGTHAPLEQRARITTAGNLVEQTLMCAGTSQEEIPERERPMDTARGQSQVTMQGAHSMRERGLNKIGTIYATCGIRQSES